MRQFRQDLNSRLNVTEIRRAARCESASKDIVAISERVHRTHRRDAAPSRRAALTRDALVHLERYAFPGNVRELENLRIERSHSRVARRRSPDVDLAACPEACSPTERARLDPITENTRGD